MNNYLSLIPFKKITNICNLCFCRAISQREEENFKEEFADLGEAVIPDEFVG